MNRRIIRAGGVVESGGFAARRRLCLGDIPFSTGISTAANVSGTTSQSSSTSSLVTYAYAAAGVAGVSRTGWGQSLMGSLMTAGEGWFGATPPSSWARKWRFEFAACISLAAHVDSQVSLHIGLTAAPTTPARPATEGVSLLFVGGASAGTVAIYSHDGSAGSTGSTGSFPRGDETMKIFALEWEPGVGFRLYVDGVLACSMATNLPTGAGASGGHETWFLISNTANGITYPTGVHFFGGSVVFFE